VPSRPTNLPSAQFKIAAALIRARQQIASASHIVVTFNFRFEAHNGLKSDIAACPSCARSGLSTAASNIFIRSLRRQGIPQGHGTRCSAR
jgi:hypothetical protein